ncbi:Crp/Fnr family transcriptional regulator [Sphingobium sp. DEHP117]|uniref:Crp/Fnr family transcriptional regulator n=1 Tax=Sphingobium sp. DEHP117 TaxID=2993436 RepID=UPI0027D6D974|nr:helix-turn-helix domain-containing protein [Sphingobium sp. DEHP117]MDQ4421839.1 Crp/Fnr family transcriptional regulator [Sphingobium sp. DEHP117]
MKHFPSPSAAEIRQFRPNQYLVQPGETPHAYLKLVEGWACRFRLLTDGRRQITALFLPGEYCEPQWGLGQAPRQPIVALTTVRAYSEPMSDTGASALVLQALVTMLDRQNEWIVSLGRKSATERLAGLFCDLFDRMKAAGLTYGNQCAMPLTQIDIADIGGLTSVHVNRVLQGLRKHRVMDLRSKWLSIQNMEALRRLALLPAGLTQTAA